MATNNTYVNWSESHKKIEARESTLVDAYKFLFGVSIPADRQYWSMAGQNVNEDGTIRDHGEYQQMLSNGLFVPSQFYGVEKNPIWHNLNATIKDGSHWVCGDFYDNIVEYASKKNFNPAIVNMDHVKMAKTGGATYLAKIMKLLSYLEIRNVMVIGNFIIRGYCHRGEYTDIPEAVIRHRLFQPIRNQWIIHPQIYVYAGANRGKQTIMGTMLMYRYD